MGWWDWWLCGGGGAVSKADVSSLKCRGQTCVINDLL